MRPVSCFILMMLIATLNGCGGGGGDAGSNIVADLSTGNPGTNETSPENTVPGLTAPATTPPATTVPESTSPGTNGTDSIKQEIVAAINQARSVGRACGATYYSTTTPIAWNDKIATAALKHSNDMVTNNFFSHTGSDGTSTGDRLTQAGYVWNAYGENLAAGYSTAAAVVQAWLGSEGHCKNIMNPAYAEIGAGVVEGTYNGFPSMRYWTLDLGKHI